MRRALTGAVLVLALVACGGPDVDTLPVVGQVLGKVELPYGSHVYLVDLPREHQRCFVGGNTDAGVHCWSTLP